MLFKPARLGGAALDPDALAADKKNCKNGCSSGWP